MNIHMINDYIFKKIQQNVFLIEYYSNYYCLYLFYNIFIKKDFFFFYWINSKNIIRNQIL